MLSRSEQFRPQQQAFITPTPTPDLHQQGLTSRILAHRRLTPNGDCVSWMWWSGVGTALCFQSEPVTKSRASQGLEKNISDEVSREALPPSLVFPKRLDGFGSRSTCPFTPSAYQPSVSPLYPFCLCDSSKILLWTVRSDSHSSSACVISSDLLNKPRIIIPSLQIKTWNSRAITCARS